MIAQEYLDSITQEIQMTIDNSKLMGGSRLKEFQKHYAFELEAEVYYSGSCFLFTSREDYKNLFLQADTLKESLFTVGVSELTETETCLFVVSYRDDIGFMEIFSEKFDDTEELEDED